MNIILKETLLNYEVHQFLSDQILFILLLIRSLTNSVVPTEDERKSNFFSTIHGISMVSVSHALNHVTQIIHTHDYQPQCMVSLGVDKKKQTGDATHSATKLSQCQHASAEH